MVGEDGGGDPASYPIIVKSRLDFPPASAHLKPTPVLPRLPTSWDCGLLGFEPQEVAAAGAGVIMVLWYLALAEPPPQLQLH